MASKTNQVWCTNFTYVFLTNGSMRYNCTIIDLYDRSVVASETRKWITSDLAIRTLEKAIHSQKKKVEKLTLHSDQGSQFTSFQFTLYCQEQNITQSMSAAGCPCDNAPMERYYNTFKAELINRFNFRTDEELDMLFQNLPMFGTIRFVHTHTMIIERPMRQGMNPILLDRCVTKRLDHDS